MALGEGEARVDASEEGEGWRVRLTDPEGLAMSTEVISNLRVARPGARRGCDSRGGGRTAREGNVNPTRETTRHLERRAGCERTS